MYFFITTTDARSRWLGHRCYWIAQALYWTGQGVAEIIASLKLPSKLFGEGWFCVYGACAGVLVTHGLRGLYLNKLFGEIRLPQVLLRVVWFSLVLTLAYLIFVMPLFLRYNPSDVEPDEVLFTIIGMFFWSWFNMITWLTLYHSTLYFLNFQQVFLEREKLNTALKDAELRALKSHLNPHFLFNALNSVRALVIEDPIRARNAITQLARILRSTLSTSTDETHSLTTEMETVTSFLNLELLRFEDRLKIEIDLDPALGVIQVPPFSIQTLVENALKHGIAPYENGGDVKVEFKVDGKSLLVSVSNTGSIHGCVMESGGTGLENLRKRLKLLFGTRATLTLRECGGRVLSEMRLPNS